MTPEGGSRRVLLTLEYRGTRYAGWQRQANGPSVQEELEKALTKAAGAPTPAAGASRTDAGVHAAGQRAHFDPQANIPDDKWPFVLNTMLPPDIRVTRSLRVGDALHARFSARGKEYEYRVLNRRFPSPLRSEFSAFVPLPLDTARMENALLSIPGRHDFRAFAAAGGSAKTTVRTMREASLSRQGEEIVLTVSGDAFLYNMVRIIAGTLIAVGLGKLGENAFEEAFRTGSRLSLGPTAPPQGLTLVKVEYEGGL
jgi:tRNA pseudouridine38-40 synthase